MDRDDRLIDYMQGRMDPQDRTAFEAEMAADPALAAEHAALGAAAEMLGRTEVPAGTMQAGWDRLSASIEAERAPMPANVNRWPALLRTAAVAVLAVGLWQLAVVPRLGGPEGGFVPASETGTAPTLRVAFADDATLADIAALLRGLGATVTDGPGAMGIFTLEFTDEAARDAAEATLAQRDDLVVLLSRP